MNEIIEGNKLIAEFLGGNNSVKEVWKVKEIPTYGWHCPTAKFFRQEIMKMKVGEAILVEHLEFHKSWDWLFHAIEKIESLPSFGFDDSRVNHTYSVEITGNGTTISPNQWHTGERMLIRKNQKNSRLRCTWLAVVDFIKWYNEELKKQSENK